MSAAPTDYQSLLRGAIAQARSQAHGALDDLFRYASKAANAVAEVTGGAAVLELGPINSAGDRGTAYQLQLSKAGSEAPPSDLGVYALSPAGYPVQRWYSRDAWESRPLQPDALFATGRDLEGNFRWMLEKPESKLVVLVTFFQGS